MVLLSALCVFILICGNNPAVSEAISGLLFGKKEAVQEPWVTEGFEEAKEPAQTTSTEALLVEETSENRKATAAEQFLPEETTVSQAEVNASGSVKYPYYEMLSNKEKKLYDQLYGEILAMKTTVVPKVSVTDEQLKNAFFAVYNDRPELFWLDASYSYEYMTDGTVISVDLFISRAAGDFEEVQEKFEQKAEEIAREARKLDTDFEKERYVHDYLVDNIIYDETHYINQNAYSALIDGRTVCAGYARAFQYVMQKLDIPCYYVVGVADEDHAWNIVELDDGFYNVDVTWDDTEYGRYDYFNRTDAEFAPSHTRTGLSVYLPECGAEKYSGNAVDNLGFPVYGDMQSYYDACYDAIVENGVGEYEFRCILQGKDLYDRWDRECNEERYRDAYMYAAMNEVLGRSCKIYMEVIGMSGDRYLVIHKITMD